MYDPIARTGGLLHFMLPSSDTSRDRPSLNPYAYGAYNPYRYIDPTGTGLLAVITKVVAAVGSALSKKAEMIALW